MGGGGVFRRMGTEGLILKNKKIRESFVFHFNAVFIITICLLVFLPMYDPLLLYQILNILL